MKQGTQTSSGYACNKCRQWIPEGYDHNCLTDGVANTFLTVPKGTDFSKPVEPIHETHVIMESSRIILRCKYCNAPFGYLVFKDGCYYIEIESRHHGETHTNHVPIAAPTKESAPDETTTS